MNHEVEAYPGELRALRALFKSVEKIMPDLMLLRDIFEEADCQFPPPMRVYGDNAGS